MSGKYERTVQRHAVIHTGSRSVSTSRSSEVGFVIKPDWPDEMVELLKTELADGQSAGLIAKTINGSGRWPKNRKSRSAVIGKISRLGLAGTKASLPSATKGRPRTKITAIVWTQPLDELIVKLYDAGRGLKPKAIAARLASHHDLKIGNRSIAFRLTDLGVFVRRGGEIAKHQHRAQGSSITAGWGNGAGRAPTLVDIVEPNPATSVHSHLTDPATQCQWPTSHDVRDMHVCGAEAVCGAYCAYHGSIAYKQAPRPRRAAAFHKVDSDWQGQREQR